MFLIHVWYQIILSQSHTVQQSLYRRLVLIGVLPSLAVGRGGAWFVLWGKLGRTGRTNCPSRGCVQLRATLNSSCWFCIQHNSHRSTKTLANRSSTLGHPWCLYGHTIHFGTLSPGIDSEKSNRFLGYLNVYKYGLSTTKRVLVPARQAENRFLDSSKGLQIRGSELQTLDFVIRYLPPPPPPQAGFNWDIKAVGGACVNNPYGKLYLRAIQQQSRGGGGGIRCYTLPYQNLHDEENA